MARSLSSVGQTFNIPSKAMHLMKSKGIIGSEIEPDDEAWFVVLGQIWGDPDFVKLQINDMDEKTIKKVMKPVKVSPIDTYILTKFKKAPVGFKIQVSELALEINGKFGCALNESLLAKIRKLRKQVQNSKRTVSKKKKA